MIRNGVGVYELASSGISRTHVHGLQLLRRGGGFQRTPVPSTDSAAFSEFQRSLPFTVRAVQDELLAEATGICPAALQAARGQQEHHGEATATATGAESECKRRGWAGSRGSIAKTFGSIANTAAASGGDGGGSGGGGSQLEDGEREAYFLEQDRRHARMHAAEHQEYAFDNQVRARVRARVEVWRCGGAEVRRCGGVEGQGPGVGLTRCRWFALTRTTPPFRHAGWRGVLRRTSRGPYP